MKKRAALIVFLCTLHFGLVGLATVLGQSTPADMLAFVASQRHNSCGPQVNLYNIVMADLGHNIFCNLTGMEGYAIFAGWSPDGTRVAVEAGGIVYIADSHMREVARFEQATTASWSANGVLTFQSLDRDIFITDQNGNRLQRIRHTSTINLWPNWSPNGTELAFVCDGEICVVDAKGENLRQLTTNGGTTQALEWSPDGAEILFYRQGQILIMDHEGENVRSFSTTYPILLPPILSPDRQRAAFYVSTALAGRGVALINTNSHVEQLLFSKPIVYNVNHIAWSSDGSYVAFALDGLYAVHIPSQSVHLLCELCNGMVWVSDLALNAMTTEP